MTRDDILRMARKAGWPSMAVDNLPGTQEMSRLERFSAQVAAHEREAIISKIESEICHAEINNLRLAPLFGQRHGPLAVRVDSLAAVVDVIRARGEK